LTPYFIASLYAHGSVVVEWEQASQSEQILCGSVGAGSPNLRVFQNSIHRPNGYGGFTEMECFGRKACKFAKSCRKYSASSYTCTHLGGGYCGTFRVLSRKEEALAVGQ